MMDTTLTPATVAAARCTGGPANTNASILKPRSRYGSGLTQPPKTSANATPRLAVSCQWEKTNAADICMNEHQPVEVRREQGARVDLPAQAAPPWLRRQEHHDPE